MGGIGAPAFVTERTTALGLDLAELGSRDLLPRSGFEAAAASMPSDRLRRAANSIICLGTALGAGPF